MNRNAALIGRSPANGRNQLRMFPKAGRASRGSLDPNSGGARLASRIQTRRRARHDAGMTR